MERNTVPDDLNGDLKAITQALADTMITRKLSTKTMLMGIHAFVMALEESGHADSFEIAVAVNKMSDYYSNLISFVWKQ